MSQTAGTAISNSGTQEMPVIERLKVRPDFLRVAATRRRWATPGLVLQVAETPQEARNHDVIRVGFTASRKVGDAVTRNRARRRLREAVRQVMPANAAPGNDFVVIARANTGRRAFADLISDLESALQKLDVWGSTNPSTSGTKSAP
ncbi:MAG: ribonuclease P protein component [Alphaproteobacteria bacterium]|nr:ribonuclease P protein component [Alphaproteobacteria bacterium]